MVYAPPERLDYYRRRLKIHVRNPHGKNVTTSVLLPFLGIGASTGRG